MTDGFTGFPPQALDFFRDLDANNDRDWFNGHRQIYEECVKRPAEILVALLETPLSELAGRPVLGKIFRIHRDLRFSADKRPYTPYLHIAFFAAGASKAMPRAGYYLGLDAAQLTIGGGVFGLGGAVLDGFRKAVAAAGDPLPDLAGRLIGQGLRLDEPELKRVPAGLPPDHPRADLLRRKSLTFWIDCKDRAVIGSRRLLDECLRVYELLAPLNARLDSILVSRPA